MSAPKRYTLLLADGENQTFSKKDAAIRTGEKIGQAFQVLSPAGSVVHDFSPTEEPIAELVDEEPPMTPEEVAELLGGGLDEFGAEASFSFPGNYSISFVPFAQSIANAVGGLETHVVKPGGLTREFHFAGSQDNVLRLQDILIEEVPATLEALRAWQKENREERRGLTDMQKFLQHRSFIENRGKTIAEEI